MSESVNLIEKFNVTLAKGKSSSPYLPICLCYVIISCHF